MALIGEHIKRGHKEADLLLTFLPKQNYPIEDSLPKVSKNGR